MAEQRLRRKRTMAIAMLNASADLLDVLIAQEARPTQGLLSRKITSLKTVSDDFGKAHEALFAQVAEDKEATELAVLDVQLKIYEDALNRAMEFKATYSTPFSVPPTLEA